jgi:3-oxoacyl-[acyl-carrier protein] reductase
MAGRVHGRVAVVTGSAGGLGQAFCAALVAEGATVVGADVAEQQPGERFVPVRADVTDEADCARLAERAGQLGPVSILVNNAGIFPVIPFEQTSLADWRRIHGLNVEGTFLVTRALLPHLRATGWGRIVTVSSGVVWLGPPGMVAYTASKAALIGFTRALASELGDTGITVNAITPGLVRTRTALTTAVNEQFEHVVGNQAVPRAEEAADLVSTLLYLCDEGSGFVTGQAINVDGGYAKH